LGDEELKLLAEAAARLKKIKLEKAFDPYHMDSRPTKSQQQFFKGIKKYKHRYAVGGNRSGKTACGAWECQKVFQNNHPFFETARNKPKTMLIIARLSKHIKSIWDDKIKPFIPEEDYKLTKQGGIYEQVTHLKNGNKIIFFSHNNPGEAQQKVQYYDADWVWLDEMPNSFKLIEELHRRASDAEDGRFIATFTPKIINQQIKKLVESKTAYHRKYTFKMLDNPIYDGRHEEVLAPMATMPENYRKTILEGEWYAGDTAVYSLRPDVDIVAPTDYSPGWRHVEAVDPAARGMVGLILFAEDPRSGIWYIVQSHYIEGAAATTLLDKIRAITDGYNIVKRVSDPHEVWFMEEASKQGRGYIGVESKNNRKKELINNLKEALLEEKLKIAPWCLDLIEEANSCQWSETIPDKIVGASRFHLLDSAQYGVDRLPKKVVIAPELNFDQQLKKADKLRRKNKALRQSAAASKSKIGKPGRVWARRGHKGKVRRSHAG
jgi:hypothetical protein